MKHSCLSGAFFLAADLLHRHPQQGQSRLRAAFWGGSGQNFPSGEIILYPGVPQTARHDPVTGPRTCLGTAGGSSLRG